MKHQLFLLLIGGLFFMTPLAAQKMTVKSVSLQPTDDTAIQHPCFDNNGDTCALVKIKTDQLEGIEFTNQNQYIKVSYSDGIYSVYMPSLSRKLDIKHKDYLALELDLGDYGFRRLRNGKTYLVVLDAPKVQELKSSVVIKVEPRNATVLFNGEACEGNENGTYEIPVSEGRYTYSVSAPNHLSQNNAVTIGRQEVKAVTVRLQPIMHDVMVSCNVDHARVYVDNTDYGQAGLLKIPQGLHHIRVQASGYVDEAEEVNVGSTTKRLSFTLQKNKKVTHIHAVPVTIHSNAYAVYKNNKKIKEWYDGATIMFMPGKYMLSTDTNESKIIIVEDEPLTIRL